MTVYEKKLENCRNYIKQKTNSDGRIMLLKGGSYKIKSYYLETNNLHEIRGASVNLSYVENTVIPDIIKSRYDENCIIYNGGGNIFCILPADADESIAIELERAAHKYLISANTAYTVMEATWEDIDNNYKETMLRLEEKLSNRKKLKVAIDLKAKSVFFSDKKIPWTEHDGDKTAGADIKFQASEYDGNALCSSCKVRKAYYITGKRTLCASCLHKRVIGENAKSEYDEEYKKYTGARPKESNTLADIDKDYVAVVYGDGNNMGQIIQNFTNITQMMEFSDTVKATANKAVFEAMKQTKINRFEVVGLGGDDVFVIVSGKIAMEFAVRLMNNYNIEFKRSEEELRTNKNPYKSTMSVGVCIAKTNTPIRIMLEAAEDKLSEAKELAKRNGANGKDTGTIAYAILDNASQNFDNMKNKFGAQLTLQPYSYETACKLLDIVRRNGSERKTSIRNLYDAFVTAETSEEAMLFFKYQNAKKKNDKERIRLPKIDGWSETDGIFTDDEGNTALIWKDIIDLYGFTEKEER